MLQDNFKEAAQTALAAHDSGALSEALQDGAAGFKVRSARAISTSA